VARQPGARGDVHDGAAVGHERRDRLDPEHRAREVDAQDAIPVLEPDLVEPRAPRDAGVVDEAVHGPELAAQPRGGVLPIVRVPDVEPPEGDAGGRRLERILDVGGDHLRALGGQRRRLGGTLPARRARDEHDLAVDSTHATFPSSCRGAMLPRQKSDTCHLAAATTEETPTS
jgi:hypothetical protein